MSFLSLIFILSGQRITVQAKSDEIFAEVAYRYMQKAGLDQSTSPKFFFNSSELKLEAAKTLSDLKINPNANIDVVLSSLVVGAKFKV